MGLKKYKPLTLDSIPKGNKCSIIEEIELRKNRLGITTIGIAHRCPYCEMKAPNDGNKNSTSYLYCNNLKCKINDYYNDDMIIKYVKKTYEIRII
jgi:hypothetical protein